jgi:uncharacterized membrane protein YjfL (UPF0719 family)
MSGDEIVALIVCVIIAGLGWKSWLGGLLFFKPFERRAATQWRAWLFPPLAGAVMLWVLLNCSAHDVRDDAKYIAFYFVMWLAWTGLGNGAWSYLGLSFRDDVLERGNPAAATALGGGLLGVTFIFAGGNIGEGPGWWVVVFSAGLATAALLLLWLIGNHFTRVCEAITIDRDRAAGARTAGFFIAAGLILGRAVAGDWQSAGQTIADFIARGCPVLLFWAVAVTLDRFIQPTPQRPAPNHVLFGVLPGLCYIVAGMVEFILQGPW